MLSKTVEVKCSYLTYAEMLKVQSNFLIRKFVFGCTIFFSAAKTLDNWDFFFFFKFRRPLKVPNKDSLQAWTAD